jgi:hypothetical protein
MGAKLQKLDVVDREVVDWWDLSTTAIDPIEMGLRYVYSVDVSVEEERVSDAGV